MRAEPRDGMTCREIRPLLSAWSDGELAPERARGVAAHVASCDGCSATVETIRALRSAVRDLRPEAGDGGATEGLAALRERIAADDRRGAATRGWRLAVAAAVALVLALAWVAGGFLEDAPETPDPVREAAVTEPATVPAGEVWDEPTPVEQAGLTSIGPEELSPHLGQACADPADCGAPGYGVPGGP